MQTYKIEIHGKEYTIEVQADHNYLIRADGIKDFVLCLQTSEHGVVLSIEKGMASVDLIENLGVAIEYFEG